MTTHACPTCQNEHEPDITIDMTGHDEALRNILHTHASFLTAAGQAIEAALAGETVEWPKSASYSVEQEFLARYYPGAHSLYLPTYLPEVGVTFPGGRKKSIWSVS